MKKNEIRGAVVLGVLLVLAHLLVFLLPFRKGLIFWFSYLFLLVAFGVAGFSVVLSFRNTDSLRSRFYGIPIVRVGGMYLAAQGALTLVFMALGSVVSFWIVLLTDALLLGAAVLGLVAQDVARDHIIHLDTRLDQAVSTIRALQSTMNLLAVQCGQMESRETVKKLAEEFRYSDPVSSPELAEIETALQAVVADLQQAVLDRDEAGVSELCERTKGLLLERNRLCKLSKKAR